MDRHPFARASLAAASLVVLLACGGPTSDRSASRSVAAQEGTIPLYKNMQSLQAALKANLLGPIDPSWPSTLPDGDTNLGQFNVSGDGGLLAIHLISNHQADGSEQLELWQRHFDIRSGSQWHQVATVESPQPTDDSYADFLDAFAILSVDKDGTDPHGFPKIGVVLDGNCFYVVSSPDADGSRTLYQVLPLVAAAN